MAEQETAQQMLDRQYAEIQAMPASQEKVQLLNVLAGDARRLQQFNLGILVTRHALKQSRDLGFAKGEVDALLNMGLFHYYAEDYENALVNNLNALDIAEKTGQDILVERCLNNLGNVYDANDEYDKARMYYKRAIEICRRLKRDDKLAIATNNMGNIWLADGNLDEARECFVEACHLFDSIGDDNRLGYCLVNLGEVNLRQGDHNLALERFQQALNFSREHSNHKVEIYARHLTAKTLVELGELKQAEEEYLRVLKLVEDRNVKHSISTICEELSRLYETRGEFEKAYCYFDRHVLLQVAIYEERSRLRMAEMRSLYELEIKELELEMERFRTDELERNVRETKRTYRQLKEAQKNLLEIEKQNTALEMSVTANHEINQPLMIIKGNLDMLVMDLHALKQEVPDEITCMDDALRDISGILQSIQQVHYHTETGSIE